MVLPVEIAAGSFFSDLVSTGRAFITCVLTREETHRRVPFITTDPVDLARATYGEPFVDPSSLDYQSPPVNLYQLHDVLLIGADGVLLHDGMTVRDTVRHISCWLPDSAVAEYAHQASVRLKRGLTIGNRIREPVFVGFNAAWHNYAHWMQECVPKIIAWIRKRAELGNPKLVMPVVATGSFQAATLRMLSIGSEDIITVGTGEVLAFDQVFSAGETELFRVSSRVAEVGRALAAGARASGSGERIYIHRRVPLRKVTNFDAIVPVLEQRAFKVVTFEDATLEQQIATMREARYVIGEHGAGLVNIIFCQRGARVLEMFNPACAQPAFWSIASVCGHAYGYVIGDHVPTERLPDLNWNSAYEMSPDRIDRAISAMLAYDGTNAVVA